VDNVPSTNALLPSDFVIRTKSTLPELDSFDNDDSEKLVRPRRVHKPYHPGSGNKNKTASPQGSGLAALTCGPSQGSTVPLTYHNGAVLTNTVNVYMIYLGLPQNSTAASWLNYLVGNLGTSPWWRVITQ
jgi:hypothetical protein